MMPDLEELGPILEAPPSYLDLRRRIREALGFPGRKPLLIGVDGFDGSGKSSLSAWLSWQLEIPAIHLDLYIIRDSEPLAWRADDLARAIDSAQLGGQRPVLVEGVLLLCALRAIGRTPDFLALVEKEGHEPSMRQRMQSYFAAEKEPSTHGTEQRF
jgi:hypothetical protein